MLNEILMYLQYPFVRYAIIVGVLVALCSSLLGVILVLKRFSYIGDGLSHVAFGAMAIAAALKLSKWRMYIILPITIIAAILLLKNQSRSKISGDAKIAMISVSSLAIGYLLMNIYSTSSNISADVCSTLFGATSILTLTKFEVYLSVFLSLLVVLMYIILYNHIFSITFDESFAKAIGIKTELYDLLIASVIAIIIVLAMNLVGSLLISALVIFPSITAIQLFKSFRQVSIASAILAIFCSLIGMFIAILNGTPVGSSIVLVDVIVFFIVFLFCNIRRA